MNPSNPPYLPGGQRLEEKTISMDAVHAVCGENDGKCRKVPHYDVHNVYAFVQSKTTADAMKVIRKERTQLVSRGTFPGSGHVTGHWLGDNKSEWEDLRASLSGMLAMGVLGIPFVGADICGFAGETTRELCIRWMQVGAFYPFSRNHNTIDARPQDPTVWDEEAQSYMRAALETRYQLLPYLYTCFHAAHQSGVPVARALMMEAEGEERLEVAAVDQQFMLGPALIVTPVLHPGASNVTGTFFSARWFQLETGAPLAPQPWEGRVPGRVMLQAGLGDVPVHVRGGHVVAMQRSAMTSVDARKTPMTLVVAMDQSGKARGELFMDDGVTIDTVQKGEYTLISMVGSADVGGAKGNVSCDARERGYDPTLDAKVGQEVVVELVRILGVEGLKGKAVKAKVNGKELAEAAVKFVETACELRLELMSAGLARAAQPAEAEGEWVHRSGRSEAERGGWVEARTGTAVRGGEEEGRAGVVWLPAVTAKLLVEWWTSV